MITDPGIYSNMPLEEYLADPCPEPSLNASGAEILLAQSPLHARDAHPRFTHVSREHSDAFDLGNATHALVLEGLDRFTEVQAPDWKTRAARQVRNAARAQGQIPLLSGQLMKVRLMAAAIQRQVAAFPDPRPLQGGQPERVVIWREGEIWCRARIDYLHADFRTIDDLKTTSESAHPAEWSRRLFDRGADLQVAFHTRGVQVVTGQHPEFRFLVVETEPPHALSLIGLDPEALAFAHTRRQMALALWARCLRTGDWPGYPRRTVYSEVPPWTQTRFLERGYYEEALTGDSH